MLCKIFQCSRRGCLTRSEWIEMFFLLSTVAQHAKWIAFDWLIELEFAVRSVDLVVVWVVRVVLVSIEGFVRQICS